jgi:hypothetical protein
LEKTYFSFKKILIFKNSFRVEKMDKYRAEKQEFARIRGSLRRRSSILRPQCLPPGMRDINAPPDPRESLIVHLGEHARPRNDDAVDRHRAQSPCDDHIQKHVQVKLN